MNQEIQADSKKSENAGSANYDANLLRSILNADNLYEPPQTEGGQLFLNQPVPVPIFQDSFLN